MRTLVVLIFAAVLAILPILALPPTKGATASEYHAFFECNRISDVSPHEGFSCDRVALFIKGQCEAGTETVICETVYQYILAHGLEKCETINTISLENGELKKQV